MNEVRTADLITLAKQNAAHGRVSVSAFHRCSFETHLCSVLGRDRRFGDNFAKELQFIPLSNDTVARRNEDIAEDVEQQPFVKLRDKLFSFQLNEATYSN
ncbi:hypothetical protein TNCV_1314621 [Trichonephila clavipes]|nr:hypothetical protein TNCV_1314621 [Trichonephila clavipes]